MNNVRYDAFYGIFSAKTEIEREIEKIVRMPSLNKRSDALYQIVNKYNVDRDCVVDMENKIIDNECNKEIYEIAREPNNKECEDIKDLQAIATKHNIDEIRIIDAESIIRSLNLDTSEKVYFLNLLKNGTREDVENEIDTFIDNSTFGDHFSINETEYTFKIILEGTLEEFKRELNKFFNNAKFIEASDLPQGKRYLRNYVKDSLIQGVRDSRVYRDEIIAFIAWSKVKKSLNV